LASRNDITPLSDKIEYLISTVDKIVKNNQHQNKEIEKIHEAVQENTEGLDRFGNWVQKLNEHVKRCNSSISRLDSYVANKREVPSGLNLFAQMGKPNAVTSSQQSKNNAHPPVYVSQHKSGRDQEHSDITTNFSNLARDTERFMSRKTPNKGGNVSSLVRKRDEFEGIPPEKSVKISKLTPDQNYPWRY